MRCRRHICRAGIGLRCIRTLCATSGGTVCDGGSKPAAIDSQATSDTAARRVGLLCQSSCRGCARHLPGASLHPAQLLPLDPRFGRDGEKRHPVRFCRPGDLAGACSTPTLWHHDHWEGREQRHPRACTQNMCTGRFRPGSRHSRDAPRTLVTVTWKVMRPSSCQAPL